ncbi:MAG: hypothetical protein C4541_11305 [Candidatus Auribacter fodinae]|uniref:O-antigen ligase-related domain-containing protein n=1 Tax=Candidatus Auribacter fodinae TaxID=2093366 RepID=A0A3A4QS80_9BACT|nr:MAG: hypothetical protein C4541_11305 [Candidatus Auribacter fodinae]
MNSVVETIWYKTRNYIFPTFMMIFALFIGVLSYRAPLYSLAMVAGAIYMLCLFVKPIWAYYLMLLVTINCFGFIYEGFLHIPGAFKLRDLCLLALMIPISLNIASDKQSMDLVKTPFNKYIMMIMVVVLLIIFYTMFSFDVPFASTLRMSRKYLFYLSFFVVMYYIRSEDDLKKLLKVIFLFGFIAAFLLTTQFAVGTRIQIMPYIKLEYQQLGGFYVPRVYLHGGISLIALCFGMSLWIFQATRKKVFFYLMMLFALGSFLSFGRANWMKAFIIVVVPFLFAVKKEKSRYFIIILSLLATGFVAVVCAQLIGIDFLTPLTKLLARIQETYTEIVTRSGTFGYRLKDSAERIQYFIDRPVFGVGFLHYVAAGESLKAVMVKDLYLETIDSGLITLLVTMGSVGILLFFVVSVAFIARAFKVLKQTHKPLFRGVILGIIGYFIGGICSFITLPFFTDVYEIPQIALAFAMVEKINQLNKQEPAIPDTAEKDLQ